SPDARRRVVGEPRGAAAEVERLRVERQPREAWVARDRQVVERFARGRDRDRGRERDRAARVEMPEAEGWQRAEGLAEADDRQKGVAGETVQLEVPALAAVDDLRRADLARQVQVQAAVDVAEVRCDQDVEVAVTVEVGGGGGGSGQRRRWHERDRSTPEEAGAVVEGDVRRSSRGDVVEVAIEIQIDEAGTRQAADGLRQPVALVGERTLAVVHEE